MTAAVVAWRCAVCATTVDVATPHVFHCPRATPEDWRHVLHPLTAGPDVQPVDDANPFLAYGPRLAWWSFARANGMTEAACAALTGEVAGSFRVTPFAPSPVLTEAVGTDVWVKDETGNVGGSHKARHLAAALLHLRAAELLGLDGDAGRSPLAIASCGNAAIAAATLAQPAEWPLHVFVPTTASTTVLDLLEGLGANITVCERRDGEPGDPALHRFREAVAAGAIPFSVQGPENALCLDGGRTLGWELADGAAGTLDRVVVQVGGGALATDVGWGLGPDVRLDTLQTEGCAPLAKAWWRAADGHLDPLAVPGRWAQLMTPWPHPRSVAEGILDDETYDWLGVFEVMRASGGRPLVTPEETIVAAHELAGRTGIDVSATGSAGLAGLLVHDGRPKPPERVAVIFTGMAR